MIKKKLLATALACVMSLGLLSACSSNNDASTSTTEAVTEASESTEALTGENSSEAATTDENKELLMGITYWVESDFFRTIADSITEAAEAEGNRTVVVDAAQDSTKQIQIIEDFISQGVDVVFLNPVDKDAILPALEKLKEANIPVINFDSGVTNMDLVDAYVATDNYNAGVLDAEAMIKDYPDGGEIAILNYPANGACVDREKGFVETIDKNDKFKIVATQDAEGMVEKGQSIASDILQANPNLTAFFCINDQSGMGAYAAVSTANKEVGIYGVDGNPEAKQVISQNGVYKMTAAQSPIKIGGEAYRISKIILETGKFEEFQVDVPAFTLDSSNINDYLSQPWQ